MTTNERRLTLEDQRSTLRGELAALGADPDRDEVTFAGDAGFSDRSHSTEERAHVLATAETLRTNLREVERALVKIDEGTGDVCDRCGEPIGAERLAAIAWATLCLDCKKATA